MTDEIKRYCQGIDCSWCDETEPCIYRIANKLKEQLDQLKEENKQLKKVSCKFKNYCTCDTENLKQTLTEIKDIVKKEIVCDDCNLQGTDKCDSRLCTSFYLDDFCKSLLQKISECEVE